MLSNKKVAVLIKNFAFVTAILLMWSCANMKRPEGGPRDLTPPKLVKATPPNMTRNFNAKQITLEFDEFFKLSNQYQEISMSPAQDKLPEYNIRGTSLVIDFKDTLQKNTTYVINFGKSIADVNESNALKNFTYVFSTGPHIDSLSISGSVTNTQTQQKEKDIAVLLYPLSKDTAFYKKKKPAIFALTDSSGNFSLNNLKEDRYRIYALKEASPNKIYDNDAELVGFIKDTINLTKDTANIQLRIFQQEPTNFRFVDRRFDTDGKILLAFNKPLQKPSIKIINPVNLDNQKILEYSSKRDTALMYMRTMDFDSLSIQVADNNKPLDTVVLRKNRKENFQKVVKLSFNIGSDNKLKPGTDLLITANLPVETINSALVTLKEDSATVSGFTLTKDSTSRKLSVKYRWKQNATYQINIADNALTDLFGNKNKTTGKKFEIDKPENYSILTLKITVPEPNKNYVIQLYRDEKTILRSDVITKSTSVVYNNYINGKYRVKVIYDANKNGRWDSGNVKEGRQPENIWLYDKEITLRPNWDAEEAISIPKEPVTP
ncbi:Ig-like domain-containing protein [Mucilaginibacter defluvii]|uniref:Ig-like domain-containing protein n=2 Tax=Mucilaginibacter defluvii TaxID=1196019 RepID=A0ABP9G5F7_9SPHI